MHFRTHLVSKVGFFFKGFKLEELPKLLNILKGTMSMWGILNLKPVTTSLATIKYANEEV